jgi:formylglycine-generating enzyme required for sulfatase activity
MLFDISFFYLQKYYFYQIICYICANNPIKIIIMKKFFTFLLVVAIIAGIYYFMEDDGNPPGGGTDTENGTGSNSGPGKHLKTQKFTVNGVTFTMIPVEGGSFTMGATPEQFPESRRDESPAHKVTLSDYYIGQTEVTQALWYAVMGSNPSMFSGHPNHPVENVSWASCYGFVSKLSQMTGKKFRMPTEAEWEYAARGGKKGKGYKFSGSHDLNKVAWYSENCKINTADYGTHPVATKAPNELGLYDMTGNVCEFIHDSYGAYSAEAQTNPCNSNGLSNLQRGGSWHDPYDRCRVAFRGYSGNLMPSGYIGMRLVMIM